MVGVAELLRKHPFLLWHSGEDYDEGDYPVGEEEDEENGEEEEFAIHNFHPTGKGWYSLAVHPPQLFLARLFSPPTRGWSIGFIVEAGGGRNLKL